MSDEKTVSFLKKEKIYTAANADELQPGDKVILASTMAELEERVKKHAQDELPSVVLGMVLGTNYKCRFECQGDAYRKFYELAYLIESAPRPTPYKDVDVMIGDYKLRYDVAENEMPNIWIRAKNGNRYQVTGYEYNRVYVGNTSLQLTTLFEDFKYLDGSVIGCYSDGSLLGVMPDGSIKGSQTVR